MWFLGFISRLSNMSSYSGRGKLRSRRLSSILQKASLIFFCASLVLMFVQLVKYSRIRNNFQPGMIIAGVPVAGLDQSEAEERLIQAYSIPIELHYQDAVFQINPASMGFNLDVAGMLAAANSQHEDQPFVPAFWAYLWGSSLKPKEVPLMATISDDRVKNYLQTEITPRYDQALSPAMPIPGSINFSKGDPGVALDLDRSVTLIKDALRSPSARTVILPYTRSTSPRPSFSVLATMLKQLIDVNGFDGVAEIYIKEIKTGNELNFGYQNGKDLAPLIAFTAASTIKIPVMITTYRRTIEPTPKNVADELELMIRYSGNSPADQLLQDVVDKNLGPLSVTSDMKSLGLENTFFAGYFFAGAPLLRRFTTPANSRTDINTGPDVYNQTTPSEMGMLLEDIYDCSEYGGGALMAVFGGEITQSECKQMVSLMESDRIGVLIQGGLPDGSRNAHKHGWLIESDGFIHTIGDAAIVYSPGGDYIISIFMNRQEQLVWESTNFLFAEISSAVYSYFNLNQ
jgi:beta-lactamase class A